MLRRPFKEEKSIESVCMWVERAVGIRDRPRCFRLSDARYNLWGVDDYGTEGWLQYIRLVQTVVLTITFNGKHHHYFAPNESVLAHCSFGNDWIIPYAHLQPLSHHLPTPLYQYILPPRVYWNFYFPVYLPVLIGFLSLTFLKDISDYLLLFKFLLPWLLMWPGTSMWTLQFSFLELSVHILCSFFYGIVYLNFIHFCNSFTQCGLVLFHSRELQMYSPSL